MVTTGHATGLEKTLLAYLGFIPIDLTYDLVYQFYLEKNRCFYLHLLEAIL